MNAETCRKKGLKDGDVVWVESKVGRVKGVVKASECIHHECVGIAGNFGSMFEHPIAKGKYPHFNALLPRGIRYQEPVGGAMEMGVRVKVYKA
jgi:thiosulfate reductase/polysulfide reductase chain A